MRVAASVPRSDIFGNVHLIVGNGHLGAPLQFVLEPSVGNSQIEVARDFEGRVCPEEDFPVVVDGLEDRGEVDVELGEIFEAERVEEDLDFLAFGVGDDLSGDVDAVGLVEDVEAEVVGQPGKPDLFHGRQAHLDDLFDFSAGDLRLR